MFYGRAMVLSTGMPCSKERYFRNQSKWNSPNILIYVQLLTSEITAVTTRKTISKNGYF